VFVPLVVGFLVRGGPLPVRVPAFVAVAFIVVVGAGGYVILRPGRVAELRWAGRMPAQAAAVLTTPARRVDPAAPRPPATRRQVVVALSRVEARELASSAWFGVGVGFCLIVFLMFGVFFVDDIERGWADLVSLLPLVVHPLVGMTVLATHRAATRSRRDDTEELFGTCPAAETVRTAAHLRAMWVPFVVNAVFVGSFVTALAIRNPRIYGPIGTDELASVVTTFVLCAGGVVLGVALGRWWQWSLGPVVVVIAIGVLAEQLNKIGRPAWSNVKELATAPIAAGDSVLFSDRRLWWHVAWLASLVALVAIAAVLRHRRDRTMLAGAAMVAAAAVIAGVVVTRPLSDPASARIADLINRPSAHQRCAPAGGAVTVCAYRPYADFGRLVADRLASMAPALPAQVGPIRLRQSFDGKTSNLPSEVRSRVRSASPLAAGEVRLSFSSHPLSLLGNRELVAFAALGLPTEPDAENQPYVAAGQARGVVALWLASQGLRAGEVRTLTRGRTSRNGNTGESQPDAFDRGYAWPAQCHLRDAPVVWSAQDLVAARAVIALPDDVVRTVVHGSWDRWRDPAAGTDELLAALGVPTVGPFDHVETRPDSC
jgi:hypothetical protein